MSLATWGTLVVLVLTAVLLAAVELLFLPLRVGGVALPITILLAALTTPLLVRGAAALDAHPGLAAAPLVAWVGSVLVFGLAGPGGDVLLPNDWRSLVLLGAGIFPSSVQLGRALARSLSPSLAGGCDGPVGAGDTVQVDGRGRSGTASEEQEIPRDLCDR